jgi:moderate conductance mechanosensitive channel
LTIRALAADVGHGAKSALGSIMADGIPDDPATALDNLSRAGDAFVNAASQRAGRLAGAFSDLGELASASPAFGVGTAAALAAVLLVASASLAAYAGMRRAIAGSRAKDRRGAWGPLAAALASGAIVALMLSGGPGPFRRALLLVAAAVPLALAVRTAVVMSVLGSRADRSSGRLAAFAHDMGFVFAYGIMGVAATALLRNLQAGPGLRDLVATAFVALPIAALSILAYRRGAVAVGIALARGWSGSPRLQRLGLRWPRIAVALIVAALVVHQTAITAQSPLPGFALLLTLVTALLWPHLDAALARWAAAGLDHRRLPAALVAARRTARPALAIIVASALVAVWGGPIVALTGLDVAGLLRSAVGVAAVLLFSAFLWNVIGAGVDRIMTGDAAHDAGGSADAEAHAPRSRLGTLLPLVAGAAKVAIMALTALTVLLALGVNVWPLVTGLSVFGLAIGFGSQTLVKDVVSGIFFLADDAFRLGEYVETSGAKGTVEKISIRSVSLRHPRGALATIPYGQIGKIQNFSRDWVIEKLTFRVAFDTDIDKVKQLFKQIGQEIAEDPELAQDLVESFKSQGIGAVEDNTIVLRGKFKARAGQQFAIRKAVFARVQKAFQEHGIKTVPRPLPAL